MSNLAQMEDSIEAMKDFFPLNEKEMEAIGRVKGVFSKQNLIPCTGCRYCMPCPKGVDIPGIFSAYNIMFTESFNQGRIQHAQTVGLTKEPSFASQCVGCGKCEKHCPQGIEIRRMLKEADKALRPLHYKIGLKIARKFMYRKTK